MTRAAVIRSVEKAAQDFTDAAPGHRYNLYFPVWQADWSPEKNKTPATKKTTTIPGRVGDVLKALRHRQTALAQQHEDTALTLLAKSSAPFATGLGNEHPTENGFAFLTPYGLPYLAGSGVKGVLRRAAEELALFPEEYALTPAPLLEGEGFSLLDVWWLFGFEGAAGAWWPLSGREQRELSEAAKVGREAWKQRFDRHLQSLAGRPDLPDFIGRVLPKGERAAYLAEPARFLNDLPELRQTIHTRGSLDFWDVFPDCKAMVLEIMTPHYGDYYRGDSTPHDSGQPVPVTFLAVPAGSAFDFHVVCQPSRLPKQLQETWQALLQAIFTHAFGWLGFGAKTTVGYGAMARDFDSEDKAAAELTERTAKLKRTAELNAMSENLRQVEELRAAIEKRLAVQGKLPVSDQFWGGHIKKLAIAALDNPNWTAEEKAALANMLEEWAGKLMSLDSKELRKQLKLTALRGGT